jgi:hypothetical protein
VSSNGALVTGGDTGGATGALLGFSVEGAFVAGTTIGCHVTGCHVTGCHVTGCHVMGWDAVGDAMGINALGLSAGAAIGVNAIGATTGAAGAATGHHALGCPGTHPGAKVRVILGVGDAGDHVVGAGITGAAGSGVSCRSPGFDRGGLAEKASKKLVGIVGRGVTGTIRIAGKVSNDAVGAAGWTS